MVEIINNRLRNRRILLFLIISFFTLFIPLKTTAQEMPPRPLGLYVSQNLSFGAFSQGVTGGTVTISPLGSRSSTGDVILVDMGYLYFPAIFELEGNPGTIVHFLAGPDTQLTGSNGGSLTLQVGPSYPGDPIIINVAPPGRMQIRVGGTLIVGNAIANPPGQYNGFFLVTFIQE
jgi:hypothetical protein